MLKVMHDKVSCCCMHFEAADSLSVFAVVTDCNNLAVCCTHPGLSMSACDDLVIIVRRFELSIS